VAQQRLTRPRNEVEKIISDLIAQGQELLEAGSALRPQVSEVRYPEEGALAALRSWTHDLERWHALGRAALASAYESEESASEFYEAAQGFVFRRINQSLQETVGNRMEATQAGINTLTSLIERLEFVQEPATTKPSEPTAALGGGGHTVFIVHGHDEAAKQGVARFLERIRGPQVVILEEQADRGRTIIEKFEQHAGDAGYAVVLLTGDDEGRKRGMAEGKARKPDDPDLKPRARQNVVLELGFFIGKLGRSRVAMLYEEGVERPSDIDGVLVLPLDPVGAWKRRLASEMIAARISLDPKAALSA
jgi:predicted nucleotide-binding protein